MGKKNLTAAATNAADKFFSRPGDSNDGNITQHSENTNAGHKPKLYEARGKRDERYGLLLDKRLKEDLIQLCNAKGGRSMNDYIVGLLIEHTEQPENKKLLEQYRKLLTTPHG